MDLTAADRAFVDALAALNDLTPEDALGHLLHPKLKKGGGWRPGVRFEDGQLCELKMGVQFLGGYTRFPKVPGFDLPGVVEATVVGGCHLEEVATIRGQRLQVLKIHGQPSLRELRVAGPALRTLSILGDPALARVDLTGAPALAAVDIFELPALKGGIVCWDLQMATIEGMGRLKKRVDAAAMRTATPDVVRAVHEAFRGTSAWATRVAQAVLAHPACPLDVALVAYLDAIEAVYPRCSGLSRCETPEDKGLFRAAREVEKRGVGGFVPGEVPAQVRALDVSGWAKKPDPALLDRLGVRVEGEPVRRAAKPRPQVKHPTDAEALATFGDWIAHPMEYGRPAEALEIVYRKVLPWGDSKTKVFLVKWRMDGGDAFVGITGPFTWSFLGLDLSRLEPLKASTRWRRLVNLYVGWYACFLAAQQPGHAEARAASLDAAGLERAFPRDLAKVGIHLGRSEVTEGADLLGNTWATGVPGRRCALRCHAPPEVYVAPGGNRHYAVAATITYQYKKKGTIKADYRLFLRGDAAGRLAPDVRHLPLTGHGVLDDLPLYHWVGSQLGPFEFNNRVGGLSLFDH
ncbi:MAG: hypothetical protein H6739_40195 [Alphaproteobacteria bacterium]|nr:hypothetical protein [Alphaproteobacteria bacterium]